MKFLISIFSIFLFTSLFGQIPDYFGNSPEWLQHSSCIEGLPQCKLETNSVYYVDGDTDVVATGELYWKIRKYGESTFVLEDTIIPSFCEGHFESDILVALLRQDERRIVAYNFDDETEEILYDFGLEEGDTLPVTSIQIYEDVVVTDLDSIMISGIWHRTFEVDSEEIEFIIEGVGHDRGFLEPMYTTEDCKYTHGCYSLYGNIEWFNDVATEDCEFVASIDPIDSDNSLLLFPNPASNWLRLGGVLPDKHKIVVYDQLGRTIMEVENTNGIIDLTTLETGSYHLQLRSISGVQNASFIKQ
ncbi:MAG: T9SS type A sorting domain-containing protein [Flavobacteriales bacterium]|nr:T9SS type A sorting domain-containing protein [Flavobacteriales bacterium]